MEHQEEDEEDVQMVYQEVIQKANQ